MSYYLTCTASVNYVSALDDLPNDEGGLTPAQFKAKFDQAGADIKSFINNSLIPEMETRITTEESTYSQNGGGQQLKIQVYGGYLEVRQYTAGTWTLQGKCLLIP